MSDAILIPDMPFADYIARPAYGSSDLHSFRLGPPALVQWRRTHDTTTDATKIGTAAHCKILEPATFAERFYVKDEGEAFRTTEAKAKRDALLAAGVQILTHDEAVAIDQIVAAFHAKGVAARSLGTSIYREASAFWTCDHSRLPCRARPDWFDAGAVYDLKITVEATKSLDRLRRRAYDLGWFHQLAQGRAGLRARGYPVKVGRLVVIAPTPPQGIRTWLFEVSENDLDGCELENENTRAAMLGHHLNNDWPGTPNDWLPCPVPADDMVDISGAVDADDAGETVDEESPDV